VKIVEQGFLLAACLTGLSTFAPIARSDYWVMNPASVPSATALDPVRLIQSYQMVVWRYLRVLGCDSALADDLTQDTFLAVLKRPFQDVSPAATSAYLRKTALNMLISYERKNGRMRAVEDIELLDRTWTRWIGDDDGEAALDHLRDCLQRLTHRARLALEMRYQSESSRAEIANALEITEHGAKNLMQRAKQQLRECVESKLK